MQCQTYKTQWEFSQEKTMRIYTVVSCLDTTQKKIQKQLCQKYFCGNSEQA